MLFLRPTRESRDGSKDAGTAQTHDRTEEITSQHSEQIRQETAGIVKGGLVLARAYTRLSASGLHIQAWKAASGGGAQDSSNIARPASETRRGDGKARNGATRTSRLKVRAYSARTEDRTAFTREDARDRWESKAGRPVSEDTGSCYARESGARRTRSWLMETKAVPTRETSRI